MEFNRANSIGEEEIAAVIEVLNSGILSGFVGSWSPGFFGGPKVLQMETEFKKYFGYRNAISVNSWTSGLVAAIGAIGVAPGDEVIVSPWTMAATSSAILHWGAIPVFVDIEPDFFCINPDLVEQAITSKTKAILAVDIFGQSADLFRLRKIADKYGIFLISDSAQSPGTVLSNQPTGKPAHITGLSLNYHKHIHTGEGGILFTDDDELALRMQLIRNHAEAVVGDLGMIDIANLIGFNFRLGEIEAAIAIEQLKKLSSFVRQKQSVAEVLDKSLSNLKGLMIPKVRTGATHAYYMYAITLGLEIASKRLEIVNKLVEFGLFEPEIGYQNLHMLPAFQQKIAYGNSGFPWIIGGKESTVTYEHGSMQVAETLHEMQSILLPLCVYDLSVQDAEKIADIFVSTWEALGLK